MSAARAPGHSLFVLAAILGLIGGCHGGAPGGTVVAAGPRSSAPAPSPPPPSSPATAPPPPTAVHADVRDLGPVRVSVRDLSGLDYLEVVIGDVPDDAPLPLLMIIHGLGDRPRLRHLPPERLTEPLRVIMPRAPDTYGSGYTWLPVRVADGQTERLSEALRVVADRLARFLEELTRRYPTRGSPIVVGGSQGGMITFTLAVHHPEQVGTAIPLMGWLPPPLVPERLIDGVRYPPIRTMHGTEDRLIPLGPTRASVEALRELGLHVEWVELAGQGHATSPEMERLLHEWLEDALARAAGEPGHRVDAVNTP